MVLLAELISKGYYSLVPGLTSIFLEMVWVHLRNIFKDIFKHKIRDRLAINKPFKCANSCYIISNLDMNITGLRNGARPCRNMELCKNYARNVNVCLKLKKLNIYVRGNNVN